MGELSLPNLEYMQKPTSRSRDFSALLFSLLRYYGGGSRQTFSSIINRTVDYSELSLSEYNRNYLTRLLADRLNVFGLIQKHKWKGHAGWVALDDGFVRIRSGLYLTLGSHRFLSAVRNVIPANNWSLHELYPIPPMLVRDLALIVPTIHSSDDEVASIANRLESLVTSDEYRNLIMLLPGIDKVTDQVVDVEAAQHLIGTADVQKFDFDKCRWSESSAEATRAGGYFRIPHEHGMHNNIVIRRLSGSLLSYTNSDSDWSYLIACRLLRRRLKWQYDVKNWKLNIPRPSFRFLPVVLRKGLCTKSFRWPEINSDNYTFADVSPNDVEVLCSRLKVIEV